MERIVRTIPYTQTGRTHHHYDFDEEDQQIRGTIYLDREVWPLQPAERIKVTIELEEN